MTGRTNTKLVWVVAAGMVWAWAGLYLALAAPQHGQPLLELGVKPGEGGIVLKGRLAELIEDRQGIHLKMDYRGRPGEESAAPEIPKLPAGIDVEYLPPSATPRRPRIEVHSGFGPVRRPTGGLLVAAREYVFQIDRDTVRIVTAPPGSPLRRRLEHMEEQRERRPLMDEQRDRRRERREGRSDGPPPEGERSPDGLPPEGEDGGTLGTP